MWCVLRCRPEDAGDIMKSCRRNIPADILHDAFKFTCDRMKRYQGSWHVETQELFPGYVFLETSDIRALADALEPYRGYVSVLEDESLLRRVDPEEEELLRLLGGSSHHLKLSRGYIRDGITHITQGPLAGMEEQIRKIDRHKRTAQVGFRAEGRERLFMAGLEITGKS